MTTMPHATAPRPVARAVVLTALPLEAKAVLAHLSDVREDTHVRGTVYKLGCFAGAHRLWEVAVAVIGAGNASAAFECERAIAQFDPHVALFIGVAGGLKDVRLGDVVAATKVYGYASGKANAVFEPRADVGQSTYAIIQRALAEAGDDGWMHRLGSQRRRRPHVVVGPIAAGEQVVSNTRSQTYTFLRSTYGDAVAVEMEGRGFLAATHGNRQVEALIVRGISDCIDGKEVADRSGSQGVAARHASAFAFEVLAKFDVARDDTLKQVVEHRDRPVDLMPTLQTIDAALNDGDPDWKRSVSIDDGAVAYTLTPRSPEAARRRPPRLQTQVELPEGVTMDALVEHAVETQQAVIIGEQYVKWLRAFLGDTQLCDITRPGALILQSQPLGPAVPCALVVPETDTRLENLLLEAFYLGHRRVRLTNRRQPHAAVVVSIDFTPAEERQVSDGFALAARGGTLTIEGRAEYGHTLRQVLPVHALLHSLQEPRTVLIQDPLTGATRYMMEGVTLPYTPHPAEQHLIDDLEVIQGAFPHKSFRFPATCTYEQAAFIHQVAMIIRTGEEIGTMGQLSFTLPAGRVDAYLAEIPDDGILRNQHIQEHKMAHFLGTDLDVGVSTVSLCPLRLVRSPEELRVEAAGRAPEERIQVTLIPADTTDPVVVRRFERFRPKGRDVA